MLELKLAYVVSSCTSLYPGGGHTQQSTGGSSSLSGGNGFGYGFGLGFGKSSYSSFFNDEKEQSKVIRNGIPSGLNRVYWIFNDLRTHMNS